MPVSLSTEELAALLTEKEDIFRSLPVPELFPGVEPLIRELSQCGKQLALVTGSSLAEAENMGGRSLPGGQRYHEPVCPPYGL